MVESSQAAHRGSALPGQLWPFPTSRERPKVAVRADLIPAISVLSLVGLVGIPIGWLWAQLAPPQRVRVLPAGELIPLQLESWHRFDDAAIFMLLGLAAGLVTGVVLWLLRERRGPVILAAAVAGSVLASWLGTLMGQAFAGGKYEFANPPKVGAVIEQTPVISSLWVILTQPMMVALVYGFLAIWNGRADLGRRLG